MRLSEEELREIGNRLTECRIKMGLSQEQVAEKLNTSRNTISTIENGGQEFSLSKQRGFSQIYGVSLDYIMYGQSSKQTPQEELIQMIMELTPAEQRQWKAMIRAYKESE